MFTLSQKSSYGLLAVFELALHHSEGPQNSRAVAEKHGIPVTYLEQVLAQLKRGGIVQSFRGSQGGYSLGKSPREISVLNVIECLEGPLQLVDATQESALHSFWNQAESSIASIFNLNLTELINHQARHDKVLNFSI
jgi:Rrf2 family transcriptional regulator, cysteine metabolism repressor